MSMIQLFRALADPSRLRILLLLQRMELAVGELALVLDQSQPRVSRHVRILCEAGLAERRREGSWVFLRLAGANEAGPHRHVRRLLQDEVFPEDTLIAQANEDARRLSDIRAARAAEAERYFAQHAAQWDSIRSLHIADGDVEARLAALLGGENLGALIDVGTGTGRMIELFGDQAHHATAIDNSPDMLRLARAKLQHFAPERLDLVQADFHALPMDDAHFDTAIMHQVLHFAQHPERALREVGRVMKPGARLAIVDFAPHGVEELRDRHAHARLGFSDAQIAGLLDHAGFELAASEELSGAELHVKIWIAERRVTPPAGRIAPPSPVPTSQRAAA